MVRTVPDLVPKLPIVLICLFICSAGPTLLAESEASSAIKYSTDYNWHVTPTEDLTQSGVKLVSLASCPPGVLGNEPEFWVYISSQGTGEAGKITGGTCRGNGAT